MQLGSYEIPEVRLIPEAIEILKKLQPSLSDGAIQSKDLAILLGYKYGTETQFYRKLKAMLYYGIMEGKGAFRITNLGRSILNPVDEYEEKTLRTKAVLNVPLWNDIYKKYKRNVDNENFWVILMNVARVERDVAKKYAGKIFNWYIDDVGQVSEEFLEVKEEKSDSTKGLSSMGTQTRQMSQQTTSPDIDVPNDYERFEFGKTVIAMPKTNIKKEWDKAKKMLDIYLEDYEELQNNITKAIKSEPESGSESSD